MKVSTKAKSLFKRAWELAESQPQKELHLQEKSFKELSGSEIMFKIALPVEGFIKYDKDIQFSMSKIYFEGIEAIIFGFFVPQSKKETKNFLEILKEIEEEYVFFDFSIVLKDKNLDYMFVIKKIKDNDI